MCYYLTPHAGTEIGTGTGTRTEAGTGGTEKRIETRTGTDGAIGAAVAAGVETGEVLTSVRVVPEFSDTHQGAFFTELDSCMSYRRYTQKKRQKLKRSRSSANMFSSPGLLYWCNVVMRGFGVMISPNAARSAWA